MEIESREYGPDITLEEREMILARIFVVEPGIIILRELPFPTVATVKLMLERVTELRHGWPSFILIVNLSGVARPTAEVRAAIRRWITQMTPRLQLVAFVLRADPILRAVAKFLGFAMNVRIEFHDTEPQAVGAARRALA